MSLSVNKWRIQRLKHSWVVFAPSTIFFPHFIGHTFEDALTAWKVLVVSEYVVKKRPYRFELER